MVNLEEDDSMIKFSSEKAQVKQLVSVVRIVGEKSEEQRSKLARLVANKATEVLFNCILAYAKNCPAAESEVAKSESLPKLKEFYGFKPFNPDDKFLKEGVLCVKLELNTQLFRDEPDGPTQAYVFIINSQGISWRSRCSCFIWSEKHQHLMFIFIEEIAMLLVNSWTDAFALGSCTGILSFQEDSKVGKFMRSLGWTSKPFSFKEDEA